MSILIKGMEMPKWNKNLERVEKIIISSSGLVEWVDDNNTLLAEYEAVELPPHGRLIDADALHIDLIDRGIEDIQTNDWYEIQQAVDDAPTIIEAEGEE